MAVRGLSLAEKEPFILNGDVGNPEHPEHDKDVKPTIFYIGNLTQGDRIEIGDITMTPTMSNIGVSMSMQRMKKTYLTVQRGLKGWENFPDEDDKPIAYETITDKDASGKFREVVSHDCMLRMDSDTIFELADAIMKKNGMAKELAKNSDTPSPQGLETLLRVGTATSATETTNESEDAPKKHSRA